MKNIIEAALQGGLEKGIKEIKESGLQSPAMQQIVQEALQQVMKNSSEQGMSKSLEQFFKEKGIPLDSIMPMIKNALSNKSTLEAISKATGMEFSAIEKIASQLEAKL